jgi:hypothetical protein
MKKLLRGLAGVAALIIGGLVAMWMIDDSVAQTTNAPQIYNLTGTPVSTPFPVSTEAQVINPANFVWMASLGAPVGAGLGVGLWLSSDGTNWSKANTRDVYEPSSYTNGLAGPVNWRWSLLYTNGQWWGAGPHDTASTNGLAQGVDLARSTDLTNWVRETVLYPFGTTNGFGRLFGSTWFRDNDGSAYLVLSYGTNAAAIPNQIWAMKNTDGTMTNWGAASLIKDTDVTQEGNVVRGTNGIYQLYYRCKWPSLEWLRATNNNLTSLFALAPDAAAMRSTNFGWGSFGNGGNSGGLSLLNVGGTHWRAYLQDEAAKGMFYLDSLDDLGTWSANWTVLPMANSNYFGQGIAMAGAQSASNTVFWIGNTNEGQARVLPPLLLAQSVQARDGFFRGGLVAGSVFAPGSITSAGNVQGDSLVLAASKGVVNSNFVDIALGGNILINAQNMVLDENGNFLAGSYAGDGSQLTGLNPNNINSGSPNFKLPILTKTGNYTLLTGDVGADVNNSGAGGTITNTLPAAAAGLHYSFTIATAQNVTVKAAGSDTINSGATATAGGGFVNAATAGSTLDLRAVGTGKWWITATNGPVWAFH